MKQEKIVTDSWKVHVNSIKNNIIDTTLYDVEYIWNNSFLNCGCRWKWRMIITVNFPIEAIGKKKPEKNQGFNRIRTRDLRVTSVLLNQLSYEATHWERGQFIEASSFQLLKLENLLRWSLFTFNYTVRAWLISILTSVYRHGLCNLIISTFLYLCVKGFTWYHYLQ